MIENTNNILVIAAHPDDEVLELGATVAKLSRQDKTVNCVILGEGLTSRTDTRTDTDKSELIN